MSDPWVEPGYTVTALWRPEPGSRIPQEGDEVRLRLAGTVVPMRVVTFHHDRSHLETYFTNDNGEWVPTILKVTLRVPTAQEIRDRREEPEGVFLREAETPKPVDDPNDEAKVAFLRRMAWSRDAQIAAHARERLIRMGLPESDPEPTAP